MRPARAALACVALAVLSCASGRLGRDESDRIDQVLSRAGEEAERNAFDGRPPPATPPNPTLSFDEAPPRPIFNRGPSKVRAGRSRTSKAK